MRPADLLRLALDNLTRNRTRSLLTLIGIMVGVAALQALLAYGAGLQQNARQEFEALELYNTLRVTPSPTIFGRMGLMPPDPTPDTTDANRPKITLTDSLLREIEQIDGVLAAYPEVVFPAKLKANGRSAPVQAEAVPTVFGQLAAYQPTEGAFFSAATDTSILIAPSMAQRLGVEDASDLIGQTITLETVSLHVQRMMQLGPAIAAGMTTLPLIHHQNRVRVAGLLPEADQPVSGFVRVVLPLDYARQLRKITFFSALDLMLRDGSADGYAAARVQLADTDAYDRVRREVEQTGAFVTSFREQFGQLERLFLIMDLAFGIIGFIALLVATLGIANTMMMNVMERRREIGVMKAVGGDERDLQRLFIAESVTLGLLGGVLGLVLARGITSLIQFGVDVYVQRLGLPQFDLFQAPVWLSLAIVGVAVLVSLLAGLAPARRAARVEPIEALRAA
ncbi:MAG: FtsX-like permease family protein [Bacteroidetes bacterium]|jgi:putative ABC transport system permease protein|nr:FtsX-like permease family protein [Bacteroidota bacterium]